MLSIHDRQRTSNGSMNSINPLSHPICFAYPLRIAPSAWIQHIPFGMFLIDILRPDVIVELGTFTGVSYCAFCQAVKQLRLKARCYAIDTWEGDQHSGFYGAEVLADLKEHHDPLYGSFSQLIQTTFDNALIHFEDGTIDLLHVDGYHTYEAVRHDFNNWLPKMSHRGVMLFHDIEVRERDFGVWRLWEELKREYPSFDLLHGHGLGLLAVGKLQPEALEQLIKSPEANLLPLREYFYRLGRCLEKEQMTQALSAQMAEGQRIIESLTTQLTEKERLVGALSAEMDERGRAVETLKSDLLARGQIVSSLTAKLDASEQSLNELFSRFAEKERDVQALSSHVAEKEQQVQTLLSQLAEKERQFERITSTLGWRILSRYGRIKYRYLLPVYRLLGLMLSPGAQHDGLRVGIDTKIPDSLVVGKGNALYIQGHCYHSLHKIKKLQFIINGTSHPVKVFRMLRRDVFETHFPSLDPKGHSYHSGFWTIVPIPAIQQTAEASLEIQATLNNGATIIERVATITLKPAIGFHKETPLRDTDKTRDKPLVAICMATYNPPLDLFVRQIQSIRNQSYSHWVCIISDDGSRPDTFEKMQEIVAQDKRFHIYPAPSRLGFYRNFERCISLTPKEAEFIALSDHDDYWFPDKLEVLLSRFNEGTSLVYSDMNIVDAEGRLIADTYWTTRPNNYKDFASLIMANTVTGAASMFRRGLLSYLLPFPERIGEAYHDHWIGCVALATGNIEYVNRPLYDYIQHSANVIGHYAPPRDRFLKKLINFLLDIKHAKENIRTNIARWRAIYFHDLLRLKLMSRVLEMRCGSLMTNQKRRVLRRIASLDESLLSLMWLWIRSLRNIGRVSETLGAENSLLRGSIWKKYYGLKARLKARIFKGMPRPASPQANGLQGEASPAGKVEGGRAAGPPAIEFDRVQVIEQKIAPISLNISCAVPRRVNLLIPTVDFKYFFGGYITKFNLARCLAQEGFKIRIVIVDPCDYMPSFWKQQLQAYQGLERLFDYVELAYVFDRGKTLEVNAEDTFIATTWWTAHIAHRAAKDLNKERFLYLIQEYEPFTFPMGTFASLANQTYSFPHYAIFSTEFLRDYFRQNALGVFAQGNGAGESHSISFQNAITAVGPVRVEDIENRSPKKLLFYARPEAHAARNMFEMALLALSRAIKSGCFRGEWEFYGIGAVETSAKIKLADGVHLQLLPRQSQDTYREVLRAHDLGLSLMYTPHPSLVPIEMASAGMLVVTNTYANKTRKKLSEISANIIAVEPTIENVEIGLREAAGNIEDYGRRVQGARVEWSTSWEESFNKDFIVQLKKFIATIR